MLHYLQELFHALDFQSLGDAVLRMAAIFLCLTVHETCHGLAAYVLGDPTAKSMHRLSLNPLRHIDWLGLAMMFVAGFGWAKPVPVNPGYFKKPKQGMALTALAGPVSNLALAILTLGAFRIIYSYVPYFPGINWILNFLIETSMLTVGLGVFNLIPIPPLDGSKVLEGVLPDRIYYQILRFERIGIVVLMAVLWTGVLDGPLYAVRRWILELLLHGSEWVFRLFV